MAAVRFQKGSEEWMMFGDLYKLMQNYWEPEEADEYWTLLANATKEFHNKYQTEISKELALAIVSAMEKKWKAKERFVNAWAYLPQPYSEGE